MRLYHASRLAIVAPLLALGLVTCTHRTPEAKGPEGAAVDDAAFAAPTELTGSMADPSNIELSWRNNATAPGVGTVEFKFPHDQEFTLLDFMRSDATQYRHPDVAPEMTYSYRIRPFFGHTSKTIAIVTGPPLAEGSSVHDQYGEEGPLDEVDPTRQGKRSATDGIPRTSIRTTLTAAKAVPSDLTATLSSPISVDLQWTDRAADEDGYLVEIGADPTKDFAIAALLPPDAGSFRKTRLPPSTKCFFRVRPFFHGTPSQPVSVTTPPTSTR